MSTARARRVEPTQQQLEAAYAAMRKRDWPGTLADALAHELYGRLVRITAARMALGQAIGAADAPRHNPSKAWYSTRPGTALPLIDRKRAAAGDRDDD